MYTLPFEFYRVKCVPTFIMMDIGSRSRNKTSNYFWQPIDPFIVYLVFYLPFPSNITLYNSGFATEASLSLLWIVCGVDLEYRLRFSLSRFIFLKLNSCVYKGRYHLHAF